MKRFMCLLSVLFSSIAVFSQENFINYIIAKDTYVYYIKNRRNEKRILNTCRKVFRNFIWV